MEIQISIIKPICTLYNLMRSKLEKLLFKKYYEKAHNYYLEKKSLGKDWIDFHENIQFSLKIANFFSNEIPPTSKVMFRNSSSEKIDYLSILFIAKSRNLEYQQKIELYGLGNRPCICKLYNFPVEDVLFHEKHGFTSTIQEVEIKILKLIRHKNLITENQNIASKLLSHAEVLNGDFVYKFGRYYNLDFYKAPKLKLKTKFESFFLGENAHFLIVGIIPKYKQNIILRTKVFFLKILTQTKIFNFIFWSLIVLKLYAVN